MYSLCCQTVLLESFIDTVPYTSVQGLIASIFGIIHTIYGSIWNSIHSVVRLHCWKTLLILYSIFQYRDLLLPYMVKFAPYTEVNGTVQLAFTLYEFSVPLRCNTLLFDCRMLYANNIQCVHLQFQGRSFWHNISFSLYRIIPSHSIPFWHQDYEKKTIQNYSGFFYK